MSVWFTILPEALFWCYMIMVIVSELMRYQRRGNKRKFKSKFATKSNPALIGRKLTISDSEPRDNRYALEVYDQQTTFDLRRDNRIRTEQQTTRTVIDDRSYTDSITIRSDTYDEPRSLSKVECRRGNYRNSLSEIRRHQRSMKLKYHQNRDNLLFYCFYKGISDKYYKTLQECWKNSDRIVWVCLKHWLDIRMICDCKIFFRSFDRTLWDLFRMSECV